MDLNSGLYQIGGELVLSLVGFAVGAAVLYLLSSGRVRPSSQVSSWWGVQRLRAGVIGVDPDWVATIGLIVAFAVAVGLGLWLGWIRW